MISNTKIILFGGTFDPVHNGHIGVAQHALKVIEGDELIFVPAYQSPHKKDHPTAGSHRIAMIKCAIDNFENMSCSDCELQRSGPSYTLQTVRFFRQQSGPQTELYWLIGADQLKDLPRWYGIEELLTECHICTMVRGGYPQPDINRFKGVFPSYLIDKLMGDILLTPEIPVSSTEIRAQLTKGLIPQNAIPDCVLHYIKHHKLYGFARS